MASSVNHPGTLTSSLINLVITTVGAGLLALPRAFADAGLIGGCVSIVFVALAADWSMMLLVSVIKYSRVYSFESNTAALLGAQGKTILNAMLVLLLFGILTAMFVIILDLVPPVMQRFTGSNVAMVQRMPLGLLCAVAAVACSLPCNITALRHTSCLALGGLLYFLCVLCFRWGQRGCAIASTVVAFAPLPRLLRAPGVMFTCYICHFNIFKIVGELSDEDQARIHVVVHTALLVISTSLYLVAGVVGYCMFGEDVSGNILREFHGDDLMVAAQGAVSLAVLCKIPLFVVPLRESLCLAMGLKPSHITPWVRLWFTVAIVGTTFTLAVMGKELDTVTGLVGCSVGAISCFVLPALMAESLWRVGPRRSSKRARAGTRILALSAVCIGCSGFVAVLLKWLGRGKVPSIGPG